MPGQRLRLDELLANRLQHRHGLESPLHAPLAHVGEREVFHVAGYLCCVPLPLIRFLLLGDRFGRRRAFAQFGRLIGGLPRKALLVAAEVPERRRLAVDRAAQIQMIR